MDLEDSQTAPRCFSSYIYRAKNKDHSTTSFSYILILISQLFSLIFIDVYLWVALSPCFLLIGLILTVLMFYNLLLCHCLDPGVLKRGKLELSKEEEKKIEDALFQKIRFYHERYCHTCKIMRPAKSSHCNHCDHCVKGFDHHCFFVGNCIGVRNRANFIGFLLFTSLQLLYRTATSILSVVLIFATKDGLKDAYRDQIQVFIGTFVCLGVAFLLILFCTRNPGIYFFFLIMSLIFVIVGSIKALEDLPGLSYYEYPVFGLVNSLFSVLFLFWLIPVTVGNFINASLNITTKEREALNEAMVFKPEALLEKKRISKRQKFKNICEILFTKRIRREIK